MAATVKVHTDRDSLIYSIIARQISSNEQDGCVFTCDRKYSWHRGVEEMQEKVEEERRRLRRGVEGGVEVVRKWWREGEERRRREVEEKVGRSWRRRRRRG